ncbi:hypothetical protein [Hydrogenimonas sp.]
MFDMSQPVQWQVIAGTIIAVFALTALGIIAVKISGCDKKKRSEHKEGS